ncbi:MULTISPECIES: PP2C family protein-serine/threonine phosphatase [unclassified Streptomyces]|uniref:PP2C family protein-serine/threonine phosphatase n=1 Tax=unclassified Streptomyces TaxID=2593676 RepID=UPI001F4E609C|nr:SpoIIE family protein phosphatase [Streptomyces sp. AmelKG-E11A]
MNVPAPRSRAAGLATAVATEQDVFALRRRAKFVAQAVGLDNRDQVRLATALSELGRDLLRPAPMTVTFDVLREPAALRASLRWRDDRTPSNESLASVTRLLPQTSHESALPARVRGAAASNGVGGRIDIVCPLPASAPVPDMDQVAALLEADAPASAIDDLRAQTRDLMAALEEAHAQRDELERLNEELTETNAGVMALYAELTVEHKDVVQRYGEEHELALTLQRSFLPTSLPDSPGVELAFRYLPSTTTAEIGGDFYEALHTPHGLLLAVGDVAGHSMQAAMVMGQLRHALRAYAAQGHPPHTLLEHLDHLMGLHQPGWTTSLCIALIEPGNTRIQIANAGHLPPLLLPPDGPPRFLREHGPLLGIGLPQPPAVSHTAEPGSRLLMITDGLIENRDSDLYARLDLLAATAATGPEEPEALCTKLTEAFAGDPDDDIIIFTARIRPPV